MKNRLYTISSMLMLLFLIIFLGCGNKTESYSIVQEESSSEQIIVESTVEESLVNSYSGETIEATTVTKDPSFEIIFFDVGQGDRMRHTLSFDGHDSIHGIRYRVSLPEG